MTGAFPQRHLLASQHQGSCRTDGVKRGWRFWNLVEQETHDGGRRHSAERPGHMSADVQEATVFHGVCSGFAVV